VAATLRRLATECRFTHLGRLVAGCATSTIERLVEPFPEWRIGAWHVDPERLSCQVPSCDPVPVEQMLDR
jgi:hypothetical protein